MVTVRIESAHSYGNEGGSIETHLLEAEGELLEEDGVLSIRYTDKETGVCRLELGDSIIRYYKEPGTPRASVMVFDTGNKTSSDYRTPYGDIPVEVETLDLKMKKGTTFVLMARVKYRLFSEGALLSDARMTITIRKE